ncbi:hypothetical protein BMT54_10280 [Pasteurellaceae bacterium 15-036681]|nr:hypothetical protein BMT54_10280 [Pasteurellaceae bacterium 15-036681]
MKNRYFYEDKLSNEMLELKRKRQGCEHNNLTKSQLDTCLYIKKNGISTSGKQKYYCKMCGATLCVGEKSNRMAWKDIKKIFILEQQEGLSIRKIAKRLGYSPSTIHENKKYWENLTNYPINN